MNEDGPGGLRVRYLSGAMAALAAAFPLTAQAPPLDSLQRASVVAGYHAAFLCSAVFVAGRDSASIVREELSAALLDSPADTATLVRPLRSGIDRKARQTFAVPRYPDDPFFRGEPRRAVFREGRGCTLLPPGSRAAAAAKLPPVPRWSVPDVARRPWPDGDRLPLTPFPPELDSLRLARVVAGAFGGSRASYQTLGVVIVHRGRVVAERYATGWGVHTQYRTWSAAKSISNALIGVLVGRGVLELDAPAPIPEWRHPLDPRRAITLDHLLRMSSGLHSGGNQTPLGYWGGIDIAADAASAPLERAPGSRWKYSNYDTILLLRAARAVLGDAAYAAFPREALLDRIGMYHTFPETDPFGNFILSSQVYTTPRDLARFGLLYLNDGVWNGERILPEGWVAYSTRQAPAQDPRSRPDGWGYGAQWWLLGTDSRVPRDAYTSAGRRGQFATVIPSRGVVVVRTGLDPEPGGWDQAGFVAEILGAMRR